MYTPKKLLIPYIRACFIVVFQQIIFIIMYYLCNILEYLRIIQHGTTNQIYKVV